MGQAPGEGALMPIGSGEGIIESMLRAISASTETYYRATGEFPDTVYVSSHYVDEVRAAVHSLLLEVCIYDPGLVHCNAGKIPMSPDPVYLRVSLRIRAALNDRGCGHAMVCVVKEGD